MCVIFCPKYDTHDYGQPPIEYLNDTEDILTLYIVEEHTDFYALNKKHTVCGHHFSRNRYYISMPCIIVVYLYPPFYPPFCFNSIINLLRAHAPARRRHVRWSLFS